MTSVSRLLLMKAYLKYLMLMFADTKVVVLKKGHAVLDQYIDDRIKNSYHVYEGKLNNVSSFSLCTVRKITLEV